MSLPIIGIHGNSSSPRIFSELKTLDIDCLLLPGHGGKVSSSPAEEYSIQGLRKFISSSLKEKHDYLLLGNSLGGHLAMQTLPQLKGCCGLVLLGTPPVRRPLNIEEAFLPWEPMNLFFQGEYDKNQMAKALDEMTMDKSIVDNLVLDFINTDPAFRDHWMASVGTGGLLDEVKVIEDLNIPVFVIHGKNDPLVNPEYIKSLNGITGIYEMENCGHYPCLERPEEFDKILQEILSKI